MIADSIKTKARRPGTMHTAEELSRLPEPDRYELIRGELIDMAPPGGEHGILTSLLATRASVFALDNRLGVTTAAETGFLLAREPDTVLAPDFAFIRKERLAPPFPKGYIPLCPDLVLETISPRTTRREIALKTEAWLRYGARMVWILDPSERTVTVHRPAAPFRVLAVEDTLTGEDVLPGFSIALENIFPKA
jgi:Uma2 family endonuclease